MIAVFNDDTVVRVLDIGGDFLVVAAVERTEKSKKVASFAMNDDTVIAAKGLAKQVAS